MPRKDLTLSEKIALLDKIKSQAPTASHRTLEKVTGVPKSTISRFLKNEQKFREEWALRENTGGTLRKRKREGKEPEVEEALNQWFSKMTSCDGDAPAVRITGPMLKTKAEDLAKKLGHFNFKATDGWLSRWKSRHEIRFKKGRCTSDADRVEKWKCGKLPELLHRFSADDIYCARETGLFYRATPDGCLCYRRETLVGSKEAMDRITVLCCSNMSGSDRRKLLVIGKHMPVCFTGLRMDALPVFYQTEKNARMTPEIFCGWLNEWDVQLQHQSRKILLLLDKCPAHPPLDCLKNIQLEFLPTNSKTVLQPMDVGIIKNLKTLYRGRLVRYILDAIEENHLQACSTATDVSRRVSMLQAVQFVADSWREIKATTIQNCFAHCFGSSFLVRWKNSENSAVANEASYADEWNLLLHTVENYGEFLSVDNNLECYNECENGIVEGITVKREESPESHDEDDAMDGFEDTKPITDREARKFIDALRIYFMQMGNEDAPLSSLDVCADFVHHQSMKNWQQTELHTFFLPI